MADPVKGRAEPEAGYRYKARCAPAVMGATRSACLDLVAEAEWPLTGRLTRPCLSCTDSHAWVGQGLVALRVVS